MKESPLLQNGPQCRTDIRLSSRKKELKNIDAVYCEDFNRKMSRHLATNHPNEIEVAKILNMTKGTKERRRAWIKLAAKGNYEHNVKVNAKGTGVIIPKYRPSQNKDKLSYLLCEFCRANIV